MNSSYEDIIGMLGPNNQSWLHNFLLTVLDKFNTDPDSFAVTHPNGMNIIASVLKRVFGIEPGCAIGALIAFELSGELSQEALDSTHKIIEIGQSDVNNIKLTVLDTTIMNDFEKCVSFSGLLQNRKSKSYNFVQMTFKPDKEHLALNFHKIEENIYAFPIKQTKEILSNAQEISFVTQPFIFPNQLCTFVSCKNLYNYFAKRNNVQHLIPLFHILALISSKNLTPIPFSRHGAKMAGIDFLSMSSFENVLENFRTGALDQSEVASYKRVSSMFLSQKLPTGTYYFDLIFPRPGQERHFSMQTEDLNVNRLIMQKQPQIYNADRKASNTDVLFNDLPLKRKAEVNDHSRPSKKVAHEGEKTEEKMYFNDFDSIKPHSESC